VPQSARDVFSLMAQQLQQMVGFRNVAVHEYQSLQMPICGAHY
jgi:uncharacterized protein YutE (UPF0331/DUF86 family)